MADLQPIGQRLDALGIVTDLEEGTLVANAIVLLECIQQDGEVTLYVATNPGMSWITKLGLLTAASSIEDSGYIPVYEEEED